MLLNLDNVGVLDGDPLLTLTKAQQAAVCFQLCMQAHGMLDAAVLAKRQAVVRFCTKVTGPWQGPAQHPCRDMLASMCPRAALRLECKE
eukprot:1157460-Pelagomonas_calceolata.AAC.9